MATRTLLKRTDPFRQCCLAAWLTTILAGCPSSASRSTVAINGPNDHASQPVAPEAIFVVEVAGFERFRILLADPARIAEAEELLKSAGRAGVAGSIRPGDGEFNAGFGWHLDPGTIRFGVSRRAECDGLPSEVEDGLECWLIGPRDYCPWACRIVSRER